MAKRVITVLVINLSLLSILLSGCSKAAPASETFEVKRGDLDIVVTTDGSLTAPDQYNLGFGTTGVVEEILVEEGEQVKQGALLAMLDNSAQINAIKTALFDIQTAKNDISFGCGTDHLPYNYADLSVPRLAKEAQRDIDAATNYFKQGNYKDAGFKLIMTYFDIEVCENLIKSKPDAAVLAGAKTNSTYYPDITAGRSAPESEYNDMVIDYLQNYRMQLLDISRQLKVGAYAEINPEFDKVQQEMLIVSQLAESTVYKKGRTMFEFPDTPTSVDFLQSSLRLVEELEKYLGSDNAKLNETIWKLYAAKLNLLVGRDVLENQTLIFESGGDINWKTLQQYNLSLQKAEIALYKAKQDIMKTVIIAPADGMVFSVNLKVNDPLSAEDFSSRPAVGLVNIKDIKFKGMVDEIDIMKVKLKPEPPKARITIDAVPNEVFTGTVKFISPFGTQTGKVIKFAVTIELDPTDVELRGGLSATADINVYSAKNVLLVPVSVIATTPQGPMVTVINEATGQPEYKQITLGKQNFQFAEVLSGLKEGEKVQVTSQKGVSSTPTTQQRQGSSNPMRVLH